MKLPLVSQMPKWLRWIASAALLAFLAACSNKISDEDLARQNFVRGYVQAPSGHSISYIQGGTPSGRRIIFVHGTPGSADGWLDTMKQAPAGFEVIAIDRPGFGETTPHDAVTSLMTQASAIEPFLDTPNGIKPIVVGHSLGGPVVAAAAVLYEDRIAGLVIAAGALDPGLEKTHPLQYVGAAPPIRWLLPRAIRNANTELMALKDELELLETKLDQLHIPIEIVHGTKDDLVPYDNVAFMEGHFQNVRNLSVDTLDGVNHFLPWNSMDHLWLAIQRLDKKRSVSSDKP
ncbi:MAG: alpha/beta hydrolase [Sphingomonadales bacterium]|jgi:pimeloyl-ACP methyl ester carboxylesterase